MDLALNSDCDVLRQLDKRLDEVVEEIKASEIWVALARSPDLAKALIRELYWEIHCYQPATTAAGFSMLGRIEPNEQKLMRVLLLHKWEEVEHRVWALDGFKALGGDLTRIGREDVFTSCGAFAVAAVWNWISKELHPLAYLGAEYLFEDLTARLAGPVAKLLNPHEFPKDGMRFIIDHAVEDERHSRLFKSLITEVAERHPELRAAILFSFDSFRHVYPLPIWLGALKRAKQSLI